MSASSATAAATAGSNSGAAATPKLSFRQVLKTLSRDQGPEYEQSLTFSRTAQIATPTALRTDRKIKYIMLNFRGRITVGASGVSFSSGSPILGTPLFRLIQLFTLSGVHLVQGSQTPIVIRGETQQELNMLMNFNYSPLWTVGGVRGAALSGTANATNDVEFSLAIPCFPMLSAMLDIAENCINGPDWPGNLYVSLTCGDETTLGVAAGSVSFSAYGSASGSPSIDVYTVRPLLKVPIMNAIVSAIPFRLSITSQPTGVVSSTGGSPADLADLFVGQKNTTRIAIKTGILQTSPALSSGMIAYASLSDAILDATQFSLDGRNLRFNKHDLVFQDYTSLTYEHATPVGFRLIDFIDVPGSGSPNIHGQFESAKLTAARKFQVNSNVTVTANALCEVIQEMTLGKGAIVGLTGGLAGTASATPTAG